MFAIYFKIFLKKVKIGKLLKMLNMGNRYTNVHCTSL